jgi:hypothetical protein
MRRPRPSAMSLTLWSECKEARLASRTPRRTGLLEQKILWRSLFDCIRGEVGSRGSAELAVRSNSAKERDGVGGCPLTRGVAQLVRRAGPLCPVNQSLRRDTESYNCCTTPDFLTSDVRATSQPSCGDPTELLTPHPHYLPHRAAAAPSWRCRSVRARQGNRVRRGGAGEVLGKRVTE